MPFSDPMADGPAIQASSLRALQAGHDLAEGARAGAQLPQSGQRHADRADGLLQSDPCLWHGALREGCGRSGRRRPDHRRSAAGRRRRAARARRPRRASTSCASPRRPPTTRGCRPCSMAPAAFSITSRLPASPAPRASPRTMCARRSRGSRRATDLPCAVGFGIKTPEQAAAIARFADGAVVGSAIVDAGSPQEPDVRKAGIWSRSM